MQWELLDSEGNSVNIIVADITFVSKYARENGYTYTPYPPPEPEPEVFSNDELTVIVNALFGIATKESATEILYRDDITDAQKAGIEKLFDMFRRTREVE